MKKRVFSLAMALVLVLSMALPAFAEAPPETANALAAYTCPNCYNTLVLQPYTNILKFDQHVPHDGHTDPRYFTESGYNYICNACGFWSHATDHPVILGYWIDCILAR